MIKTKTSITSIIRFIQQAMENIFSKMIKNNLHNRGVILHAFEIIFSIIILGLYFVAFLGQPEGFSLLKLPVVLFGMDNVGIVLILLFALINFFILFTCLFKIASIILKKIIPFFSDPERIFPQLVNIISSFWIIFCFALYLIKFAFNYGFFSTIPYYIYILMFLVITYNISYLVLLINTINRKNPHFNKYLKLKKEQKKSVVTLLIKTGIQKKLIFSFIGLIIVLIMSLCIILLSEFNKSIQAAVIYSGTSLTEQTANFIKTIPDTQKDLANINFYFNNQKIKNETSVMRFISLSYYTNFINDVKTDKPKVFASTDEKMIGKEFNIEYTDLKQAKTIHFKVDKTYEFITPVILGGKIIGYAQVSYNEDVIYEAYFKTQLTVFLFSLLFIYISIVIIYVVGSMIVFPIMSLKSSVNQTSSLLESMLSGKGKVSADLLTYQDTIKTKDEIKTLSVDIENMIGVIRGIIPYISTSTFKHSDDETLSSSERNLAFLFTDIRGFTTLCEGLPSGEIVDILNRYLDLQTSIVIKNFGDIDKFVGDELMATFQGKNKERDACKTAMEIRQAMAEETEIRKSKNLKSVAIGIGINTGKVAFGNVGAKNRMDCTSIGDTVNLAARLEGANKTYGTKTLITEKVFEKVNDYYICREIDFMTVKGKSEPVRIFEILQSKEKINKVVMEIKQRFEEGLFLYRAQNWDKAASVFKINLEKYNDEVCAVFLKRARSFKQNPPEKKWDGVFHLTVK